MRAALVLPALLAGCLAGQGDGFVVGTVRVAGCRDDKPLERVGDYDLGADFFAGDSLIDSSGVAGIKRSSVTIRIQETSNRVEKSDGLVLHFQDVAAAARAFAAGDPVGAGECFDLAGCPSADVILRSQLNLYNSCPGSQAALTASNRQVVGQAANGVGQCLRGGDVAQSAPLCPQLSAADKDALQALCDADFNDRNNAAEVARILGRDNVDSDARITGGACLYLCQIGQVRRGQDPQELEKFEFDYGERIAGIFSFNMVDARAFMLGECSDVMAQVQGMFSFEMVRSRAAQAFP